MDKIQQYWNERAVDAKGSPNATTNDIFLRQLECAAVVHKLQMHQLPQDSTVLDVGCGDGGTTLELAKHFPDVRFHGVDFSSSMIGTALSKLSAEPELHARVKFSIGDARNLGNSIGNEKCNAIVTNRCLINIPLEADQYRALRQISERLVDGGLFVGSENFVGGQLELNRVRLSMNLPEIPIRWHNLYFSESVFLDECEKLFSSTVLENFSSSYYYATRIIYSALCKIENSQLDYGHPIHRVAMQLPAYGDFSPIKLIVAVR
jgi:ubiquinone/menaquinone biosynthesis C-methylase UbiE